MPDRLRRAARLAAVFPALCVAACASSPVTRTGALTSYDGMTSVKTIRTRARIVADGPALAAARSVRIAQVAYGPGVDAKVSRADSALVANLVGRVLCLKLSDKFDIAPAGGPADLTVRVVITRMTPTNREAAGVSVPLRAASMAFGVPFAGRVPIGMGAFAAEGEAVDASGAQRAGMTWARGADMFTNRARVSKIGDAYELSAAFSGDLAALIVTGKNPLHDAPPLALGKRGRPVPAACDVYGKSNGAESFLSGFIGAPPGWTDSKSPPAPK